MKSVPNKTCSLPLVPGEGNATFATLLELAANQPPTGGFDLATIRKRNRIVDIAKSTKKGGEMKFEDADFAVAQEIIRNARWGTMNPEIDKFAEAFGL